MYSMPKAYNTNGTLRNNTATKLKLDNHVFWSGTGAAPQTIEADSRELFAQSGDDGSIGGLCYNMEGNGPRWIVAWLNASRSSNLVHTKILEATEAVSWSEIYSEMKKKGLSEEITTANGYTSHLSIDATGDNPTLTVSLIEATIPPATAS